jgi:DHA1 family tetracycline resistance protein-like MFS transporter
MSLTAIFSPILFTAGLFSYFTSDQAPFQLPGAPFFLGSLFLLTAMIVIVRLFGRIPETAAQTDEASPTEPV